MLVRKMIEELQKYDPNAEVKLHHHTGHNALFVLGFTNIEGVVVIEDKSDNDLRSELSVRYEKAAEDQVDELDFYTGLIEQGFTLDDIKENVPEFYDGAKSFCEEHGLV